MNRDKFKYRVAIRQEHGSYKMFAVTCICYQPNGDITVDYNNPALPYGGDAKIDGENAILEQCTGLADKTGKLIFEGDVILFAGVKMSVEWDVNSCRWLLRYVDKKHSHYWETMSIKS